MSGDAPERMLLRRVVAALVGLAATLAGLGMPRNLLASTTISCDEPVLMAAPQDSSAQLGWAIAVGQIADQTWLAAGANQDDQDDANAGSVSMFMNPGPDTAQTGAKLFPTDPQPGGQFGTSVAIDGDWLAVGAPGVPGSGAVYLFHFDRIRSSWVQTQKLAAADAAVGAQFGFSVSLSGPTLVVGAPGDSARGSSAGSVYVFALQGTVWQQSAKLDAYDGRPFDEFGAAVAVAGNEIVVGAPFADDLQAFQNFGAAYVFQWTMSGGWALEPNGKLTAGTFRPGNIQFGSAVAVAIGTIGGVRIVVGAPGDHMNMNPTDSGSAYVFERDGAGWTPRPPLIADVPRLGAQFGTAVRLDGDRVLIGARFDGSNAGAAYLFEQKDGSWPLQFRFLHAPGGAFGQSVAILGTEVFLGGFEYPSGAVTPPGAVATCSFGPPPPCFELKKTHTSSSGPTGVTVAFQVRVVNCGASPLTVTVSDDFQGTGLIGGLWCPGLGCTPSKAGKLLDTVTLRAGMDQVYTVAGMGPCAASVANTACVAVAGQPLKCKQDVAALAFPAADLAVTGSGSAAVVAGDAAAYDWQVENLGPCPAHAVVLTAPLAPDLDLVSAPSFCAAGAGALTCSLGTLNPRDKKPVPLVLQVQCDRAAGPLTETARVTAVTPDPVTANNSAAVTTTVNVTADYSIVKTCPAHAEPSDPIAYTLTVRNGGPSCPTAAVRDLLPAHLLDGQWCRGASCTQGNVAAQVALLPLDSTVFSVRGVVDPVFLGRLSNTATVTLLQGVDPVSGNNSDTCTTIVTSPPLTGCTIDARPAATLLLPYFEVDLNNPNGLTTLFSVNNALATAILVHVVVWSDLSVPVLDFNIYLTGYDVQSVNLRDILVNGNVPQTASAGQDPNDTISPKGSFSQDIDFASCDGFLPPRALPLVPFSYIAHLQAALTGKPSAILKGLCAGQYLGDNIARGYVTMDTVNNCTLSFPGDAGYFVSGGKGVASNQNALWGDWFIINAEQNVAEGSDLVHIEASATNPATSTPGRYTFYGRYVGWTAVDNREPLATNFAVSYMNGGPFSGGTSLLCWRDSKVSQSPFTCPATPGVQPAWYPLGQESIVIFDQQEDPVVQQTFPSSPQLLTGTINPCPAETQRVQVGGASFPAPFNFGWLYMDMNTKVAAAGNNPPIDPVAAQAWIIYTLAPNGHFAVGIDAIRLDSACAAVHFDIQGVNTRE